MTMKNEAMLELRHITKLYTGTVALRDVSFTVRKGEVHGLIGKNGAGKSTLVGVISGLVEPSSGEILVDGKNYNSLSPILAKKHRIAIITQEPQVVEECSVAENLFMPNYLEGRKMISWKTLNEKAQKILKEAGFDKDASMKMRDLSISERQLLLVIKACYAEDADIVIMDEVSASLSQKDCAILYRIIDDLIAKHKTVLFISHHTEELLNVCDLVTVIRDGQNVGTIQKKDLDKKRLAALIVGNEHYKEQEEEDHSDQVEEEILFHLEDFTSYGKFHNISLSLRKGEIVGLAGLRGSGRTEIMKSIVGIDPHDKGKIYIKNNEKSYAAPAQAIADGVVYIPEEREAEGLIATASIDKNLTVSILPKVSNFGLIKNTEEGSLAERLIKLLDVKAFSKKQEISQLSGGNKQKVLIGKALAATPTVCLLDEPTRGVDIEAKDSILHTINAQMRKDSCVLLSSPGVEDLIKICDRIIVLYKGQILDEFKKNEFSEQDIYRSMQGERIHLEGVPK